MELGVFFWQIRGALYLIDPFFRNNAMNKQQESADGVDTFFAVGARCGYKAKPKYALSEYC